MEKRYAPVSWKHFIKWAGLVEHVHDKEASKRNEAGEVYDVEKFYLTPFLPPPFPDIRVGACQECGLVAFAIPNEELGLGGSSG